MLFLERVNDVTRLLVDPARDGHDEDCNTWGKGDRRGEPSRGSRRSRTSRPASVQRRISPSDGVDRVLGQDGMDTSPE